MNETVLPVFKRCVEAIHEGALIKRESNKDKEYHFQNWFAARLDELNVPYDSPGRNLYPDPHAGEKHIFRAWRLKGSTRTPVVIRDSQSIRDEVAASAEEADEGSDE